MPADENVDLSSSPQVGQKRPGALELGPRKKSCVTLAFSPSHLMPNFCYSRRRCYSDPLVHHGRHFGRTVFALCNFQALLNNGILRMVELPDRPLESLSPEFVHLFPFLAAHSKRFRVAQGTARVKSIPSPFNFHSWSRRASFGL